MDRLNFLRKLLGNAALLTLPPWELLAKPEQDRLAWTTDAHLVFVFDAYVRGFMHYAGPQHIRAIRAGDPLDLLREYDNEHDVNAVAVYWNGHKLGFLPMGENVGFAFMLDHGLRLKCTVVGTHPDAPAWEQCFIDVHLMVPRNPSFDAYITHYLARPDAGYKQRRDAGGRMA